MVDLLFDEKLRSSKASSGPRQTRTCRSIVARVQYAKEICAATMGDRRTLAVIFSAAELGTVCCASKAPLLQHQTTIRRNFAGSLVGCCNLVYQRSDTHSRSMNIDAQYAHTRDAHTQQTRLRV
jgi:hypothetical protein